MLRARIAEACEADSPFDGEVEADESCFGARRVRGVRGRGARGKTIVFGLLKRVGKVYTRIVPDVTRRTSMQAIEGKVSKDSTMYTDGFAPLRRPGRLGLQAPLRGEPRRERVRRAGQPGQPHRRHRGLLGIRQEQAGKIPGCTQGGLLPPSEGMRVQVQHAGAGHVQIHASGTPGKAPKLGKPLKVSRSRSSGGRSRASARAAPRPSGRGPGRAPRPRRPPS